MPRVFAISIWGGFDKHLSKLDPQGKDSVIWNQMPAECSMTLVRITIELHMLNEEMLKGF